ncbi:hypothetical protein IE53DRAFT_388569 [Violaceomyces palustris]|uniref:Uncharacterized protein n=1 Tax=Violaceomyces palustris TaxID=1673888 RepID=A0ACD0NTS4_9BASI|nr:hypothetical protein IE53DRAFT_388569 [Violaceomyces palustris]
MDGWKPYLHASLFSGFKEGGVAFLFPSFIVDGTWTFLGASAFTIGIALLER